MENKEIAVMLKRLHTQIVHEVSIQNAGTFHSLDAIKLYECVLNALWTTQGLYCSDKDPDRIPRPSINPLDLLQQEESKDQ